LLYLRTLGGLSLHRDGPDGATLVENSKYLAICAVLAASPEYKASREFLCRLLWPDLEQPKARRALRQAIHYLTGRAGEQVFLAVNDSLALEEGKLGVDLHELESAIESADDQRTVQLYAGRFLDGLECTGSREFEELAESRDAHVRAGVEVAYTRLIKGNLEAGNPAAAIEYARGYVELNPLNEEAQMELFRTLEAGGDRVGALQANRSYCALLRTALEEAPSDELERYAACLREELAKDPTCVAVVPPPTSPKRRSPWRWALLGGVAGALLAFGFGALALRADCRRVDGRAEAPGSRAEQPQYADIGKLVRP
jgi:DNA-binding SARP family transcriptional activator